MGIPESNYSLKNARVLVIRESATTDAQAVLNYLEVVCAETDFLSFGPGEFELTVPKEEAFIRQCRESDNQLFMLALLDDAIAGALNFTAGLRPRVRHTGEFGMSVAKEHWGLGIGSLMLDTLVSWARASEIIKKINELEQRPKTFSASNEVPRSQPEQKPQEQKPAEQPKPEGKGKGAESQSRYGKYQPGDVDIGDIFYFGNK